MPRFSTGTAKEPGKLGQYFSFSGRIRGADVLLRLVEACGYEVVREALEELKPEPVVPPVVKRRRPKPKDHDHTRDPSDSSSSESEYDHSGK